MTNATTTPWWTEALTENMDIVLSLISDELQNRAVPPIPAIELSEEIISTALLIGASPHHIKLWLSDQPPRELTASNFRNWYEWFVKQSPAPAAKPAPTQRHQAGVWQ